MECDGRGGEAQIPVSAVCAGGAEPQGPLGRARVRGRKTRVSTPGSCAYRVVRRGSVPSAEALTGICLWSQGGCGVGVFRVRPGRGAKTAPEETKGARGRDGLGRCLRNTEAGSQGLEERYSQRRRGSGKPAGIPGAPGPEELSPASGPEVGDERDAGS